MLDAGARQGRPFIVASPILGRKYTLAARPGRAPALARIKRTLFVRVNWIAAFGTMLLTRWNWQKVFSYGEVICFISAWAIGLLVAMQQPPREATSRVAATRFAASPDVLGIQARLGH